VRRVIALAGQSATVDEDLTGRENLVFLARLAGLGRAAAKARAAELLAAFGLDEAAPRQARAYSGGMRRRLDLAASLIARAEVYFLDEPTTGLDPASRAQVHQIIRALAAGGAAVLPSTSTKLTSSPPGSRSSTVGRWSPKGHPASSKPRLARAPCGSGWPTRRNGRWRGKRSPGCCVRRSRTGPTRCC